MKLNHISTAVVFVAAGMLLAVSCGHESKEKAQVTHADSVLFAAGRALDYTRLLELTDSFEHEGAITRMNANRWRGVGYNNLGKVRSAEYYYRKVVDAKIETDKDLYYYNKSVRRLAELLVRRGEYEEALRVAMPAIDRLRSSEDYSEKDMAILLNTIGCCQLNLGRLTEAAQNYESARQRLLELAAKDPSHRDLDDAIMAVDDIALSYINTHHYSEAQQWTAVTDSLMAVRLQNVTEDRRKLVEEYRGRVALHRMLVLQGMGQQREAAKLYRELADSDFGKSDEGLIGLATYLMEAGRMGEAADNFTHLDQLVQQRGLEPTLDNISTYLLPKYKANVGAGRIDSALAVGLKLCDMLDSVLVTSKSNDAAELATIYDTQQKENMIAEQQADMSRQRMRSILIVSLLVFAFLAFYIYHRIKAQRRLAHAYQQLELAHHKLEAVNTQLEMANTQLEKANTQLETANAQLEQKNEELTVANERAEESSRMKTNFIQQISHEIRTPLNILSGFTQVITMPDMELDDDTRQDINRQINENTNRITGLVNKMLELSDVNSRAVIEKNDYVLAIQIAAQAAEDSEQKKCTALGIGWARTGGESLAIEEEEALAVDGIENVSKVLEEIENDRLPDLKYFEGLACDGGCVGGPIVFENVYIARNRIRKLVVDLPKEKISDAVSLEEVRSLGNDLCFDKPIRPIEAMKLDQDFAEALKKMDRIEEIAKQLPGLDCGSCGSPTCRALAEDIVCGYARELDCLFLLKQKVSEMAKQMVEISELTRE